MSSARIRFAADRSRRLGILRSALDVASPPPSSAPFLIKILVAVVAIIAVLILLRLIRKSPP